MTNADSPPATGLPASSDALSQPAARTRQSRSSSQAAAQAERGRLSRDCTHPRSRHEHGTRTAYVLDRCRCDACTDANRAEAQRRRKAIAYGRWQGLVPADAARDHVQRLRSAGISLQRIAACSGVGYGTVARLAYPHPSRREPPTLRLRHDTAQRLLQLRAQACTVPPGARVDATGSRRRLQALMAAGWPLPTLARQLGRTAANLRRSMHADAVTDACARHISTLYEALRDMPPPGRTAAERVSASRAKATARTSGWLPHWAWDDIDGDSDSDDAATDEALPGDTIDEIAVERAIRGDSVRLTSAERDEVIAHLTTRGLSARRIADIIGTSSRNVVRRRAAQRAA